MVQLELTGLQTTSNQPVSTNPRLETDLLNTTNQSSQCARLVSIAKSKPTSDSLFQDFKLNQTIINLESFRDQIIRSGADTLRNLPTNDSVNSVKSYMNTLNTGVLSQYRLLNTCMKESTDADWNELNSQRESTSESKDRLESLQHPERKVSYYEGWFPLFRPMSETALFILFSIAIFFLLISLAFFLRLSGVQFNISLPFGDSSSISFFESYKPYIQSISFTSFIFAIVIVAIGYSRGWFSKS